VESGAAVLVVEAMLAAVVAIASGEFGKISAAEVVTASLLMWLVSTMLGSTNNDKKTQATKVVAALFQPMNKGVGIEGCFGTGLEYGNDE